MTTAWSQNPSPPYPLNYPGDDNTCVYATNDSKDTEHAYRWMAQIIMIDDATDHWSRPSQAQPTQRRDNETYDSGQFTIEASAMLVTTTTTSTETMPMTLMVMRLISKMLGTTGQ